MDCQMLFSLFYIPLLRKIHYSHQPFTRWLLKRRKMDFRSQVGDFLRSVLQLHENKKRERENKKREREREILLKTQTSIEKMKKKLLKDIFLKMCEIYFITKNLFLSPYNFILTIAPFLNYFAQQQLLKVQLSGFLLFLPCAFTTLLMTCQPRFKCIKGSN